MAILVFIGSIAPGLLSIQYFSLSFSGLSALLLKCTYQHLARAQHRLSVGRSDRHRLQSFCSNSYLPNGHGDTEVYIWYTKWHHCSATVPQEIGAEFLQRSSKTLSLYILLIDTPLNSSDRWPEIKKEKVAQLQVLVRITGQDVWSQ